MQLYWPAGKYSTENLVPARLGKLVGAVAERGFTISILAHVALLISMRQAKYGCQSDGSGKVLHDFECKSTTCADSSSGNSEFCGQFSLIVVSNPQAYLFGQKQPR